MIEVNIIRIKCIFFIQYINNELEVYAMKMNIDIKKLQCAMASKCYNASDLALYSRLSNATITRIFKSGSIGSLPTLGRIAKALDVKPIDLIRDE